MSTPTVAARSRSSLFLILCIGAAILVSMGWFAKSNWFKAGTPASACKLSRTAIYDKYKFTVPAVFTEYVYNVSIKGSAPISFTLNADGEWSLYNENSTPIITSGAGFFVSEKGHLITNKHVVEPWNYNDEAQLLSKTISYFVKADLAPTEIQSYLQNNWEYRYQANEGNSKDIIEELIAESPEHTTPTVFNKNDYKATDITTPIKVAAVSGTVEDIRFITQKDINIMPRRVKVYIAIPSNEPTAFNTISCNILNRSGADTTDMALLQITEEHLPKQVKSVFNLDSIGTASNMKPGTKAYLLYYPIESISASTKKDIQVQIFEGQIIKKPNGITFYNTITSEYGAIGSPVVNDCGQLIAINSFTGSNKALVLHSGMKSLEAYDFLNKVK